MTNELFEPTISSKTVYDGKIIKVNVDTVRLPNGNEGIREIVHHQGAVGVLAITPENKIVLVKQFRKALEQTILEIPAGKLEKNEQPIECAIRELKEETGYIASNITQIARFYTSPGFANELIYLYEARGLIKGEIALDFDEFVELEEFTLQEVMDLINDGKIIDAKTLVSIYYWQAKVLEENTR